VQCGVLAAVLQKTVMAGERLPHPPLHKPIQATELIPVDPAVFPVSDFAAFCATGHTWQAG
jgi:hypothetical protein